MTILKHIKIFGAAAALGLLTISAPAGAQTTYNVASLADFTGPYADVMKDLIGARRPVIEWWNAEVGKKIGVKLGTKDYDHRYDAAQVASLWPGIKAELNPIIVLGVGGPDVAALLAEPLEERSGLMAVGRALVEDPRIGLPGKAIRGSRHHHRDLVGRQPPLKRGGSGPLKVAIISSEASPAYVDQHKGVQRYASDNPDKVEVVEVVFTEVQPTDLTTQVNRVTRKGAEVIMVMTNTAAVVATKRALQSLGKQVPIVMSSHNGLAESGRAIGDVKQMEGDYEVYAMAAPTDTKTPGREFFEMLQSKYDLKAKWTVSAVQGLGQALIAMRAIEAAAKKVGADKVTGEAVREALMSTTISADETYKILGNTKFSNDGPFPTQGLVASIVTIKDGKYTEAAANVPVPSINKW